MKTEGRYDESADIAWLRFEGCDPSNVVAEEDVFGLRELDPTNGRHGRGRRSLRGRA